MKVLFATSEAFPLSKTGGLGDVCGSLPGALRRQGVDCRIALPAYAHALERAGSVRRVSEARVPGNDGMLSILEATLPGRDVPVYLISAPWLFDHRPGTPYHDLDGREWRDNAQRFAAFARVVEAIALGRAGLDWLPDVVHSHDWTAGLVPALLARQPRRPPTVFTIHNLAHQGLFSKETFQQLGLPGEWWSLEALEFWGKMSLMKAGLVYADWLTTVSPTYAQEICRPDNGCGLDGLLRHRKDRLVGILNGADDDVWSPGSDTLVARPYASDTIELKGENKRALQRLFGFAETNDVPLVAHIARLVEQKGIDLLIEAIPNLVKNHKAQVVVLGRGEARFAQALTQLAARLPSNVAAYVGYSEELAHRITAGADVLLMPSRFEPCGLNQIYALRYGAVPVVRRTGGLADTVIDASPDRLLDGTATGFQFDAPTAQSLEHAVGRAVNLWRTDPAAWKRVQLRGMAQDFGWERGAKAYRELYERALATASTAKVDSDQLRALREPPDVLPGRVPLPSPPIRTTSLV
jgi:starch synthase